MKPTTSFKWLILTILALHARPLPSLDLRCGVLIAIHSRAALKVQALERAQTRFVSLNSGSSWEDFLQENPFHDILGRATVYVANSRENQNKIFAGEAEIFAEVVQRVEAEVDELAKARGAFSGRLPNYGNIPIGEKTFETLGYSDVYLAAESFLRQNLFRLCQANSAEPDRVINSPRFFENFHDAVIDDIWNTLRVNPGRFFPPKPFGTSIESHFESAIITVLKRPKTEKPESVSAPILEDEPLPNQRVLRKFIEHHFTIPRSGLDIEPEGWRKLILNLQKPIARVAGSLRLERKPFVKLTRRGLRAPDLRREMEFEFLRAKVLRLRLESRPDWEKLETRIARGFVERFYWFPTLPERRFVPSISKLTLRETEPPAKSDESRRSSAKADISVKRWAWMAARIKKSVPALARRYGVTPTRFWEFYTESAVVAQIGEEAGRWTTLGFTYGQPTSEAAAITDEAVRVLLAQLVAQAGAATNLAAPLTDPRGLLAQVPAVQVAAVMAFWDGNADDEKRRSDFRKFFLERVPPFSVADKNADRSFRVSFQRFQQILTLLATAPNFLALDQIGANGKWAWVAEREMIDLARKYAGRPSRFDFVPIVRKLDHLWVAGDLTTNEIISQKITHLIRDQVGKLLIKTSPKLPISGLSKRIIGRPIPSDLLVRPATLNWLSDEQWVVLVKRLEPIVVSEGKKFGVTWEEFWKNDEGAGFYSGEDVQTEILAQATNWFAEGFTVTHTSPENEIARRAIRSLAARVFRSRNSGPPANWKASVTAKKLELIDIYLMLPKADIAAVRPAWDMGLQIATINDDTAARAKLFTDIFEGDVPTVDIVARHPQITSEQNVLGRKIKMFNSFFGLLEAYDQPEFRLFFILPPAGRESLARIWGFIQYDLQKRLALKAIGVPNFWEALNARFAEAQWQELFLDQMLPFDAKIQAGINIRHTSREVAERILEQLGFPRTTKPPGKTRRKAVPTPAAPAIAEPPVFPTPVAAPVSSFTYQWSKSLDNDEEDPIGEFADVVFSEATVRSAQELLPKIVERLFPLYRVYGVGFWAFDPKGTFSRFDVYRLLELEARAWVHHGYGDFSSKNQWLEVGERAIRRCLRMLFRRSKVSFPNNWRDMLDDGMVDSQSLLDMIPWKSVQEVFALWSADPGADMATVGDFKNMFITKLPQSQIFDLAETGAPAMFARRQRPIRTVEAFLDFRARIPKK